MQHLDLTLATAAENLALDDALLEAAELGELASEILRLWELPEYCVVLGRSSAAEVEVNLAACREGGVPVLRRSSGGGTILAGPGCLMVSLVLDLQLHPHLAKIDAAHEFVLQRLAGILTSEQNKVMAIGTSDLALRASSAQPWQKFSGNAMRLKRSHLLYHGTLLYDFDLDSVSRLLATPTRTPAYRQSRSHAEFVANFSATRDELVEQLVAGWNAEDELPDWPQTRTAELTAKKYTDDPKWVIHNPTE